MALSIIVETQLPLVLLIACQAAWESRVLGREEVRWRSHLGWSLTGFDTMLLVNVSLLRYS